MTTEPNRSRLGCWLAVVVFALAMAWVESAVVYYLRTHIDRLEPYQANPLPIIGGFGPIEFVRELATMVMLLTVGLLAGRTWRARFGYLVLAFGVWDIFYYVFLKVMCGWPHALLDWDILFLLPLPCWGPGLAPVLIAGLMIIWGTLATRFERQPATILPKVGVWLTNLAGGILALFLFMADTLEVAQRGVPAIRAVLPVNFNWPLFLVALGLMAAPLALELRLLQSRIETAVEPADPKC